MAAPKATPTAASESDSVTTKSDGAASLKDEITAQGLKVRDLKSSGADRVSWWNRNKLVSCDLQSCDHHVLQSFVPSVM